MTSEIIRVRKGLDIRLTGEAKKEVVEIPSRRYACKPVDFTGITPRLLVREGDAVQAGTPLFTDKQRDDLLFTSPVSGTVREIRRGEKRLLLEIVIEAAAGNQFIDFGKSDPTAMTRDEIAGKMLKSGVWPLIRQRPFDIIAHPQQDPKTIVIPAFDTHPLAPDDTFIVENQAAEFRTGLEALKKLTTGKIHLNIPADKTVSEVFTGASGVQVNRFSGPHPTGNVSTQISRIDPINKGDIVWYLRPTEVIMIGRLFLRGVYDASKIVALTGSMVSNPVYVKTLAGACVQEMIRGNLHEGDGRIISGNVLTGRKIDPDGFIGFYDTQVTVIPEGNYHEFLGWAVPGAGKYSFHKMFLSSLFPKSRYNLDTNMHGSERAFVMTGKYEQVFPFEIYPMHMLKAILAEDIERMEDLGIYEIDAEDFALAEFIDTSKIELQAIVRRGLEMIRKETT